jgi:hypothetical protein
MPSSPLPPGMLVQAAAAAAPEPTRRPGTLRELSELWGATYVQTFGGRSQIQMLDALNSHGSDVELAINALMELPRTHDVTGPPEQYSMSVTPVQRLYGVLPTGGVDATPRTINGRDVLGILDQCANGEEFVEALALMKEIAKVYGSSIDIAAAEFTAIVDNVLLVKKFRTSRVQVGWFVFVFVWVWLLESFVCM